MGEWVSLTSTGRRVREVGGWKGVSCPWEVRVKCTSHGGIRAISITLDQIIQLVHMKRNGIRATLGSSNAPRSGEIT